LRTISRVARVIPQGANSQVQMKQNVVGAEGYDKTSPFLFLSEDWFGPLGGFETHPHRGMQTVTIVLEGTLEHRDHTGAHGLLEAGDVQWMTAGRGVLHSEMPMGKVHTLQLWLNLPAKMKMIPARYQDQRLKDVPVNGPVRVYAGRSGKAERPHGSDYPMWLLEIRGSVEQGLPASYRGFVYMLEGEAEVGGRTLRVGDVGWSEPGEGALSFAGEGFRALLFAGEPIDEPVAAYGPFVMNTRDEIIQAFEDYQAGRLVA
jgi:redox-sensitive bicupin YhaK (pirin superfamily)